MINAFSVQTAYLAIKGGVGGLLSNSIKLLVIVVLYAPAAWSHEYWLSPIAYHVDVGSKVLVDIRNGENFSGSSFPYQQENVAELLIIGNGEKQPIKSRLGDYPAIHPTVENEGLYQISLSSTERTLVYDDWDKFEQFLIYHGLSEFIEKHQALGFPKSEIKEYYFRFAKTFVHALGDDDGPSLSSEGSHLLSSIQGHELELVLGNNPYAETNAIDAQLLFEGAPLANRQVELFTKSTSVKRVVATTDVSGRVRFDNVLPGEHMINAVHMLAGQKRGAHWKTLWASVTLSTIQH